MSFVERYSTTIDIYSHRQATPRLTTAYLCFKIILLVANLIFMIFGCALMGVGSYALNNKANALAGQTLPSGLIAMGVFILILSAIGAISAWKESFIGLAIYLTLLLLITIILFSIGVAVVVKKNSAGSYIQQAWMVAPTDVKNSVQIAFDCCGLTYWNDSSAWPCPITAQTNMSAYCYPQLVSAFNSAYSHAGATGIAFSVIMGCGMILVICLMQGIKQKKHQENLQHIRTAQNARPVHGGSQMNLNTDDVEGGPNDVDSAAASMFDKHGYHPEEHNPITPGTDASAPRAARRQR